MLKQITNIFIILLGLLFLTTTVFAQSDEQIAKKYGISFPVAELGNCGNVATCKAFCDNPNNHKPCSDFAKKHNLSKTSSAESDEQEILKLAKTELGCTSHDACMAFCEREENMEKCMDFAARHNLIEDASQMQQRMTTVKNLLGCGSMKSCMDFCNSPTNTQKCMEAFKQAGFSVSASYSGPGGCNSEESCQAYCEKNPKECGGDNFQGEPPEVWCSKVSSDCKWDGTTCICGGATSPQESGEIWCPKSAQAGQICSWDGTSCNCWDPEACQKAGCTWTGSECKCEGTPQAQTTVDGSGCIQQGCNWTGTTCDCSVSEATSCNNSGCTWDGTSCQCPVINQEIVCPEKGTGCYWDGTSCICDQSVQGASTSRSLLQQILDFILRR